MRQRTTLLVAVLAGACLPACSHGQDGADRQLSTAAAGWKKRRDVNRTLEYQLTGKWAVYPPSDGSPFGPPGNAKGPVVWRTDRTLLIDWETGKYRRETKNQTSEGFDAADQVYNGKVIQGRGRELLPSGELKPGSEKRFGIGQGSLAHAAFPVEEWPVFLAGGVVPSKVSDEYYPGHTKFSPELDLWRASGFERIEGRDCTVFRTYPTGHGKRSYEVAIDLQRDAAIVRMTGLTDQRARFLNLSIRWKQSEFGWQPSSWRYEVFRQGALASYYEFTVTAIRSPPVSSQAFELVPDEHEVIVKNTYSERGDGTVEKEELFQEEHGSLVPVEVVHGEIRRKRTWWAYVPPGLGLVLACGLAVRFHSRRRFKVAG